MSSPRGSFISYSVGFVLSLVLTLGAYLAVVEHLFVGWGLVWAIVVLALVQLAVQLELFLHLGAEARPRWKLLAFGFAALVVVIVVFGSLWIMNNLNYHMSPSDTTKYIIQDEGIK